MAKQLTVQTIEFVCEKCEQKHIDKNKKYCTDCCKHINSKKNYSINHGHVMFNEYCIECSLENSKTILSSELLELLNESLIKKD